MAQRLEIKESPLLFTHSLECEEYIDQGQSLNLQNLHGVSSVRPQSTNCFHIVANREIPKEELADAVRPNPVKSATILGKPDLRLKS
jgi:hypothetical protein